VRENRESPGTPLQWKHRRLHQVWHTHVLRFFFSHRERNGRRDGDWEFLQWEERRKGWKIERERASCVYFQSCWLPDDSRYGSASGCCPSFLFYSPSPFVATALSVCHTPRVFKISMEPTTYTQRTWFISGERKMWDIKTNKIFFAEGILKIQVNYFNK